MANSNNVSELSTTASSNSAIASISILGTGLVSTADDAFRTYGSFFAKWWNDIGGVNIVAGTSNAITITTPTLYAALKTGMLIGFKAGAANTTAATVNVDALGAAAIRRQGDTALQANDILSGGKYLLCYDSAYNSTGAWVLLNPSTSAADLGITIDALTGKTTPVDADEWVLSDSAASQVGKKVTGTNFKAYMKTYWDTLYQPLKTILTTLGNLANASGVLTNNGSGALSWVAAAATGQPIPASSTFAIGTLMLLNNSTGASTADGATIAGSALKMVSQQTTSWVAVANAGLTGTWTNVHGSTVVPGNPQAVNNCVGYFVRTA